MELVVAEIEIQTVIKLCLPKCSSARYAESDVVQTTAIGLVGTAILPEREILQHRMTLNTVLCEASPGAAPLKEVIVPSVFVMSHSWEHKGVEGSNPDVPSGSESVLQQKQAHLQQLERSSTSDLFPCPHPTQSAHVPPFASSPPYPAIADAAIVPSLRALAAIWRSPSNHHGACRPSGSVWFLWILLFFVVAFAMESDALKEASTTKGPMLRTLLRSALASQQPCTALAEAAHEGGVKVIAVDFDMTMITTHSGGSASNTPGNPVFTSLSADFDTFATAASAYGIKIAVVTFGDPKTVASYPGRLAGAPLVHRVLEESAASFRVDAVFPFYPPLYKSPTDYRGLGLKAPMPYNKSFHIAQLCAHFGVLRDEVLLVDDDANNCMAFNEEGGVALRVQGGHGFDVTDLQSYAGKGRLSVPRAFPSAFTLIDLAGVSCGPSSARAQLFARSGEADGPGV
ncbi:uncharacterized protein LOC113146521 [Cyclospora cayetanensis]|uniref:Uncharacterized protein LOC113146521 n=1 Tax=Cyclospora cayetanensis TaxID=88456 RepID=A0A6P6RQN7_9EIME|nr:uncharacterized protein LOC113146521 [Cyclospora cayetanensis]